MDAVEQWVRAVEFHDFKNFRYAIELEQVLYSENL
jgi:hypothetical protein